LNIVVACGGTGGHVFPGLTTARNLRSRGHAVTVWLSGRTVEEAALPAWDGPIWRTGARPLRAAAVPAVLASVVRCVRQMRRTRPDRLLAMGSYASLPPAVAAWLCRVPVVLHEANTVPGQAVDWLSRLARVTAVSFPGTEAALPGRRVVLTGLPVRRELAAAGRPPRPAPGFAVLVTGGSQGAHAVNERACGALCRLAEQGVSGLRVLHQSGAADADGLRARYAAAGVAAQVVPFIRDMGAAYAAADVAVCRAGAVTCAELCLCGVPAILIPLPGAVRDHQRHNAAALAAGGGAVLAEQGALTDDTLAERLRALADAPSRRAAMADALLRLAVPDADARLADCVAGAVF
jgi:UDP-N-acetylglucosamine--N-acetylmuramyl-(pentapeptide) pyrophosphoryl-undecaprenol N-acetylglucosamine transferase